MSTKLPDATKLPGLPPSHNEKAYLAPDLIDKIVNEAMQNDYILKISMWKGIAKHQMSVEIELLDNEENPVYVQTDEGRENWMIEAYNGAKQEMDTTGTNSVMEEDLQLSWTNRITKRTTLRYHHFFYFRGFNEDDVNYMNAPKESDDEMLKQRIRQRVEPWAQDYIDGFKKGLDQAKSVKVTHPTGEVELASTIIYPYSLGFSALVTLKYKFSLAYKLQIEKTVGAFKNHEFRSSQGRPDADAVARLEEMFEEARKRSTMCRIDDGEL